MVNTPTTPPPLTPSMKRQGVARLPTLDSNHSSDDDLLFSLAILPKGHQVIVHGIIPALNETPAAAIKNLLVNLESDPHYKDFATFGLNVQPFSDHASNISLACYVEILPSGEDEPCMDLLKIVMDALMEARLELEVRWSTSKKGRSDECLSCHLLDLYPGVTDQSAIPSDHLPLIKAHIKKKGFKIASIFASYGSPQITFLLPFDADCFNALLITDILPRFPRSVPALSCSKRFQSFAPLSLSSRVPKTLIFLKASSRDGSRR